MRIEMDFLKENDLKKKYLDFADGTWYLKLAT